MLDGLDAVDWAALRHAYGAAADVPALLRAVAGDDPAARAAALHALHGTLWHQGTVYEATAPAVPFLLELAARPGAAARGEVLCLLGLVARGRSYHAVHAPADRGEAGREPRWAEDARAAIRARLPAILVLGRDPEAAVRRGAAFVAACLPLDAAATRPALRSWLAAAAEPLERAVMGLALAVLGELALPAFEGPAPAALPVARLAALAAATAGGAFPPEDALDVLLDLAAGALEPGLLDDLGAP